MKFRTPNPKLEDELAMEYLKRMREEDNLPNNVLYLPTIPQQIEELREQIKELQGLREEINQIKNNLTLKG